MIFTRLGVRVQHAERVWTVVRLRLAVRARVKTRVCYSSDLLKVPCCKRGPGPSCWPVSLVPPVSCQPATTEMVSHCSVVWITIPLKNTTTKIYVDTAYILRS